MRLDSHNIRARLKDTLIQTLQITFIENDESTIEAIMPVGAHNLQTMHVLHGGATIALAESIAGIGSNLLCADDEEAYGMQISANHMTSAKMGDTVRAIGTIIHKGRSTHVWRVDVTSEKTGKLVSTLLITNAILKKKKNTD